MPVIIYYTIVCFAFIVLLGFCVFSEGPPIKWVVMFLCFQVFNSYVYHEEIILFSAQFLHLIAAKN